MAIYTCTVTGAITPYLWHSSQMLFFSNDERLMLPVPDKKQRTAEIVKIRLVPGDNVITMENFGKKWFISASSGLLGRILLVGFGLGAGIVGSQFISVPIDSSIIKGAGVVAGVILILLTIMIMVELPLILQWFAYRRDSENEKLQLENENLKLKLELQEKQSKPDNDV